MSPASQLKDLLNDQFGLKGTVFVVTGASSGIGRAMSGFLADAGASIVAVARRQDALIELEKAIIDNGGNAKVVCADLGQREEIPEIAQQCLGCFGRVDGVINAAGINLRQPVEEITLESWDSTLNLNLSVPFFFSREFIPGMEENGFGRIINIASLQSTRAFPDGLAYGASKGGVCQLTRAMAETWSKHGITCNAIAPGFFSTELTAPIFANNDSAKKMANQTAIGRNGEMADLFGITVFFASQASSYITGQTLHVDGGFTAK